MPSLRSIFSLLALGSVMVDNPMPQRLIARAVRVVALVVLSSMLVGAFLVAALAYGYEMTVAQGIPPLEAGLYILGTVLVLVALAVFFTVKSIQNFLKVINVNTKKPVPLTTHLSNQLGDVVEAFVTGFLSRYNK